VNFEEAHAEYTRLRQGYDNRQLSAEDYGQRVQGLQVRDANGGYWAIDGNSGGWLRYDGSAWVQGQPPLPQTSPPPGPYGAPSALPSAPQGNVEQPAQGGFGQQPQGGFGQQQQGNYGAPAAGTYGNAVPIGTPP